PRRPGGGGARRADHRLPALTGSRMRKLRLAALVTSVGAAAVVTGAGVVLADEDRRHQLERQLRVWRLTARRTLHYGTVWIRGRGATAEERARLEERFAIRTAEDVAEVLGGMKGAIMKAGQMVSFIAEGLPPEAQAALATLQADVPPMAPSLADELDYRLEASCQAEFARRYRGHPFIHVPDVVPERSSRRVITSEWVDGRNWAEFLATADEAEKQRAGEILFRFAEGSIWRHGVFNGDPHPGNYRFHDGRIS